MAENGLCEVSVEWSHSRFRAGSWYQHANTFPSFVCWHDRATTLPFECHRSIAGSSSRTNDEVRAEGPAWLPASDTVDPLSAHACPRQARLRNGVSLCNAQTTRLNVRSGAIALSVLYVLFKKMWRSVGDSVYCSGLASFCLVMPDFRARSGFYA